MRSIEDMAPDALPNSYDSTEAVVQGAGKYEQIGDDAADKILTSMLDNVNFEQRAAVVIADLNPGVGNMFQAFMKAKQDQRVPLFFLCVCESTVHLDWCRSTWVDTLVANFQEGKLNIPGAHPQAATPPSDILETLPPKPQLKLLTYVESPQKPHPTGLAIPADVVNTWYNHGTYGVAFREFYDKLVELYGPMDQPRGSNRALSPPCPSPPVLP